MVALSQALQVKMEAGGRGDAEGDLKYEISGVVSGGGAGWNGLNRAVMNILSLWRLWGEGLAGKGNVGRGRGRPIIA